MEREKKPTVKVAINGISEGATANMKPTTKSKHRVGDGPDGNGNDYKSEYDRPSMDSESEHSLFGEDAFSHPTMSYPIRSNYFKLIYNNAEIITTELFKNNCCIGTDRMECLILSEEGQFVLFANVDNGANPREIDLHAFLPYMCNGELNAVKCGRLSIASPNQIIKELESNNPNYPSMSTPYLGVGPFPMPLYGQVSPYMPMPTYGQPYGGLKRSLSAKDYMDGLTSKYVSHTDPQYKPICIWGLNAPGYGDIVTPSMAIPERAALKALKGKPMPLICAGAFEGEDWDYKI